MIEYNKIFYFSNLIFYIKKIPFIKYIKKEYNKVKINKKIKKNKQFQKKH